MTKNIEKLFDFINNSNSVYHTVEYIKNKLVNVGYIELKENETWNINENSKYFVIRDGSSIIAFNTGSNIEKINIVASHDDSPTYKLKPHPTFGNVLNLERYGGVVDNSWMDIPVGIAGRVFLNNNGVLEERIVDFNDKTFIIPRVAPHMQPDYSKIMINDMFPMFSNNGTNFIDSLSSLLNVDKDSICSHDLFLYSKVKPYVCGINDELIVSPKLDDLECAFGSIEGLLNSKPNKSINVCAIFNNEEVGSLSVNGASSTFIKDVLERTLDSLKLDKYVIYSNSMIVSADNAHAIHPIHKEKADYTDFPVLNGGIVIKSAASLSYTSDGLSSGKLVSIYNKEGVKFQYYTNNGNIRGGSTLGRLLLEQLSINCVDIGLAQLGMHSSYETAGSLDVDELIKGTIAFYGR